MSWLLLVKNAGCVLPNGETLAVPDLQVLPGDRLQLAGPSGAGKTTFLRAIAGLEPIQGEVTRGFQRLGYAFQEPRLVPGMSVMENLCLCCGRMANTAQLEESLGALGLEAKAQTDAARLSGGEAQRVNLLRALMVRPDLLLLDEAGASLDDASRALASKIILSRQAEEGFALIQVSHMTQRLIAPSGRVEMPAAAAR